MKYLPLLILFLAPVAFGQQSYPQDITLSWINASEYEPIAPAAVGEPIAPGDLIGVRIECFRQGDVAPTFTSTVTPTGEGLAQSEIFVGVIPKPGTYECFGYSLVSGAESDPSIPVSQKFIGKPKPIVFN